MKVVHIITGLKDGGAEGVLFRLCSRDTNLHIVISLSDFGKYGPILVNNGIETHALNMRFSYKSIFLFFKLVQMLNVLKPSIVQTWMYHADLIGGLAARMAGIKAIVWGIRQSTLENGKSKKSTIYIAKILAKLSWHIPAKIVVCAQRSIGIHESLGYSVKKMKFIPNGYDILDFSKSDEFKHDLRKKLGISSEELLIGMVARFDPYKDYPNLLQALSILQAQKIKFKCLLVGDQISDKNLELTTLLSFLNIRDRVILCGQRDDVPFIMSALDLHVLSSSAEGFPNVVAEAMAAGTPCVVTDVGDAAFILGGTGWVVPSGNPVELAKAIECALNECNSIAWKSRCIASKKRIEQYFSMEQLTENYRQLWAEVASECVQ